MSRTETFEVAQGDIRAWIEQGSIHVKAVDQYGDPVEMNVDQLKSLIAELSRLYEIVKANG